ncbi:hypothetical protein J6590_027342 [Homalodisca vitripennis]|nr:hypothetical protein J6590_027342 [Homalodisca vitripennis]
MLAFSASTHVITECVGVAFPIRLVSLIGVPRSDRDIGHLRKHLHTVGILQVNLLCRLCDEQEETAEHLLFECLAIAMEQYAIFGSLDKGSEFPQENLVVFGGVWNY